MQRFDVGCRRVRPVNWPANKIESVAEPRATRIDLLHRPDIKTQIWMGGTDSLLGHRLTLDQVEGAVVVDCCGDLPVDFQEGARLYLPRVFMDAEAVPYAYSRLVALAHGLATEISAQASHEAVIPPPDRIFVLCHYGMNRSGLFTGLLLRALGEDPVAAIDLIRRLRPGALSNRTYVSLIERETCPLNEHR